MKTEALLCPLCGTHQLSSDHYALIHRKEYFLCLNCDLLFLGKQYWLTADEEMKRYQFHNNNVEDLNYKTFLNEGVQFAIEHLNPKSKILDFGSGITDLASQIFCSFGFDCQSYDPYFRNFSQIFTTKVEPEFDGIFVCEVVEHFKNPSESWMQMLSLLKHGGKLIVRTKKHHCPLDKTNKEFLNLHNWWYLRDPTHVVFYSSKTIDWLCLTFELKQLAYQGDLFCLEK